MQSVVAQTNHQQTKIAAENKWQGDLFMNWEKPNGKNPIRWFSGHHSRNSTIIIIRSYKQGIPNTLRTYSWTLIPIPNQTCSVMIVSLSDARLPSTWLTNCIDPSTWLQSPIWKDCWPQSSSIHPHDEDLEDAWSQNPKVQIHKTSPRKRWTRSRTLSLVTICLNKVWSMLVQLVYRLTALETILLYV